MLKTRHPVDDNRKYTALEQQDREIGRDLCQTKGSRMVHGEALMFDQYWTPLEGFSDFGHSHDAIIQQRKENRAALGKETFRCVWRVIETGPSNQGHYTRQNLFDQEGRFLPP